MASEDRINYLNIGLMLLSAALAFALPFELFLLAYAVLGPLHYLTEISWLHDRGYFLRREESPWSKHILGGWLALVGFTLLVMIYGIYQERVAQDPVSPAFEIWLFYIVFASAAALALRSHPAIATGVIVLTGTGAIFFSDTPWYGLIAFLIITIVHLLVFTGAFMLQGALRARSLSGIVSIGVFAACIASFFLVALPGHPASAFIRETYAPFEALNAQLIRAFGLGQARSFAEVYESSAGAAVMRLIAFAYTYHYLNWFTKTSVIGWHRISKGRGAVILLLWAGALAAYAYSYVLGFVLLYSLSVLHVMLELPLNSQSFAGIGRELRGLAGRPKPV